MKDFYHIVVRVVFAVQYVFYPEKFKSWLKEQIKLYSWSTTDEEAEEISNNIFWKWFESSSDYDKYYRI